MDAPRQGAGLLVVSLAAALTGCYSSYARTSTGDGGVDPVVDPATDELPDASCTIRESGDRVVTGIDTLSATSYHYDFTWAGAHYLVVWDVEVAGGSEVRLTRMDGDGETFGSERVPSNDATESTALNPRLAWTGSRAGVSWDTFSFPQQIRFRLLEADGAPDGPSVPLVGDAPGHVWGIQQVLAWTGTHFVVAWPYEEEGPNADGIAVVVLSRTAEIAGPPLVFSEGYTGHPDVQGREGLAALLWRGESNYITLFEGDGTIVAQSAYTDETGIGRHLAAGTDDFAVVWSQDGFYFMTLDPDGAPATEPLMLAETNAAILSAEVVWTPWGWAVAWQQWWTHPSGLNPPLRIVFLQEGTLVPLFDEEMAEFAEEGVSEVHLAWTGSELGMMWNGRDMASPEDSLIFTKFTCD